MPYLWEEGSSSSHVHDPVDLEKLLGWTGREPDYHIVVQEPLVNHNHGRRLICYYHPEGETLNAGKARRNATAAPARPAATASVAGAEPARAGGGQRGIHRKLGEIEARLGQLGRALESERSRNRNLTKQRENLEDRLRKRGADLKEARKGYNKAVRERDRSNSLYAAIKQSNSWRYTSPLRKLASIIKS